MSYKVSLDFDSGVEPGWGPPQELAEGKRAADDLDEFHSASEGGADAAQAAGGGPGGGPRRRAAADDDDHEAGLRRWQAVRAEWRQAPARGGRAVPAHAPDVDIRDVVDSLTRPEYGGQLPRAMPLRVVVDVLQDLWEMDGIVEL